MNDDADRSVIMDRVKALAKEAGLQRRGLAASLGHGLCRLWGIDPGADDLSARKIVIPKFAELIDSVPDGSPQRYLRLAGSLSFNISSLTEGRRLGYTARREWLDGRLRKSRNLPPLGITRSKNQVIDDADLVYAHMADVLQKEWQNFAPGEPFPVDDDAVVGKLVVASSGATSDLEVAAQDIQVELRSAGAVGDEHSVVDGSAVVRFNARIWRNTKWLAPIAVVSVVAAITVPLVINHDSANVPPSRAPSNNSQPIPVAMAAGPVHVDSIAYVRDGTGKSLGYSYVFPRKLQLTTGDLADLNKLSGDSQSYDDWMLSRGAVNPDDAPIQLTLRNKTSHAISITNIQLVKQCVAPLSGTLFYAPPQGAQGDIYLTFNLDDKFSTAKNHETGVSYFAGDGAHTIQLAPNETSTLLINATTKQYYCQFHFNLIIDPGDGTSPVSELVDNNGKPFAVTAVPIKDQFGDVTFPYYQAVYAFYKDANAPGSGLGYGAVNPVTYNGG